MQFGHLQSVAQSGLKSLAQGLPWVVENKRFALKLKGLETCTRSGSKVPSRLSLYLMAPSGLIRVGRTTQGKPWVNPGLRSLGHFGPQIGNVQTSGTSCLATIVLSLRDKNRPPIDVDLPNWWCHVQARGCRNCPISLPISGRWNHG